MHIVPPALIWQPAVIPTILPKPITNTEMRFYDEALHFREKYSDMPTQNWKFNSLLRDMSYVFLITNQRYYVMCCPEALWSADCPYNLLSDPLILLEFNGRAETEIIKLLPFVDKATATDYKIAADKMRECYGKSNHPADVAQLDHAADYFTQRERQCRDESALREWKTRISAAPSAWDLPP